MLNLMVACRGARSRVAVATPKPTITRLLHGDFFRRR
jgi:hypothetical protein